MVVGGNPKTVATQNFARLATRHKDDGSARLDWTGVNHRPTKEQNRTEQESTIRTLPEGFQHEIWTFNVALGGLNGH